MPSSIWSTMKTPALWRSRSETDETLGNLLEKWFGKKDQR